MSSNLINSSEKKLFKFKITNILPQNEINTIKNKYNNYSEDKLMKREDIIDSKLKFKPIFEKINRNKKKFNHKLLNNLEQREKTMEKIISVENLINFIFQTGMPYKIDLKKNIRQSILKEKINKNSDQEKIDLGTRDYFSLDTFSKGKIKRQILNKKNEEHLLNSKNFKTRKSGIPEDIDIYTSKNIIKSTNNIKNKSKSRLFYLDKKNISKIIDKKSQNNSKENSYNTYYGKKMFNSVSNLNSQNLKSERSGSFKGLKPEIFLHNKILINADSKKLINSRKLNIINIKDNDKNNKTENLKTIENTEMHYSGINFNKDLNKSKRKKPKKNIRILLLENNMKNIKDKNILNFKMSISDLNKYNKRNININSMKLDDSSYSKEEKMNLKNEQFENTLKNLGEVNNKIRKVFTNYNLVMNKRSLTERNKQNNFKIIKTFSSLGKKTINNMATDLGLCQNHIKEQLINVINDLSFKRENLKQLDPTLEIILDTKIKKEENNQGELVGEDNFDYLTYKNDKDYQKKEIARLSELIGKMNSKVAFDLSSYLVLYNRNLGNKIEGIENKNIEKKRNIHIKYLKKSIESQIYKMKKINQRNLFDYNKIIHKFNDFYTKIQNEKQLNEEYKKYFS